MAASEVRGFVQSSTDGVTTSGASLNTTFNIHPWLLLFAPLSMAALVSILGMHAAWAKHWPFLWRIRHAFRAHELAMIACGLVLLVAICVHFLSGIVVSKPWVSNAADPAVFAARVLPGFVSQNRDSVIVASIPRTPEGDLPRSMGRFSSKGCRDSALDPKAAVRRSYRLVVAGAR